MDDLKNGGNVRVNLNFAMSITDSEIDAVMAYHPWDNAQIERGSQVRDALSNALKVIIENVPPCPDRSSAIRKLRECRMDCNSAITFNGGY
jgi:hypothetical protein